ncbi:hypothetical protein [Bifidobacterium simiiventris]|uniref:hypothetical protein n=1 Tax=Bifidobacterium simiiventris TaxID=2834434 RepID=UPI001C5672DF|nr:hypothetical protein [Bifidobacterium simiiventris]MBW3077790.1 hypothetical protein [Bifidobacterium simiiventris]
MAAVIILLLCCGSDALNVRQLLDGSAAYRRAGGDIMIVNAPERIDGAACGNLTSISGVQGAMAIRVTEPVTVLALPDAPYVAYETSSDPSPILDVEGSRGLIVARGIADRLGLGVGDKLHMRNGGGMTVTGIYDWPNDGRQPQYASVMFVDTPASERSGMFDSCWVRAWPMTASIRDALYAAVADAGTDAPGIADVILPTNLNPLLSSTPPDSEDYTERPSRFAPLIALIVFAAIGAVCVRTRLVELAMERHFGAGVAQIALHVAATVSGWMLPACLSVGGLLAMVLAPSASGTSDALTIWCDVALRGMIAAYCGVILGVIATASMIRVDSLPRLVRET